MPGAFQGGSSGVPRVAHSLPSVRSFAAHPTLGQPTPFLGALTETGSAADTETGLATFAGILTESGTAADTQTGLATFAGLLTETLAASDGETGLATFVSSLTETGAATDSETGLATFVSSLTETGSAADSSTGLADFLSALTETLAASDSAVGGLSLSAALSDTLASADSEVPTVDFAPAISESVAASDSIAVTVDFAPAITETLAALDAETGVFPTAYNVSVDEALAALDISDTESAQTIGNDGAFLPIRGRNRQKATPKQPEKKQEAKPTPKKQPRKTAVVFEAAVSETIPVSDGQTCEVVRYVASDISVDGEAGKLESRADLHLTETRQVKEGLAPPITATPVLAQAATEPPDVSIVGRIVPESWVSPRKSPPTSTSNGWPFRIARPVR